MPHCSKASFVGRADDIDSVEILTTGILLFDCCYFLELDFKIGYWLYFLSVECIYKGVASSIAVFFRSVRRYRFDLALLKFIKRAALALCD